MDLLLWLLLVVKDLLLLELLALSKKLRITKLRLEALGILGLSLLLRIQALQLRIVYLISLRSAIVRT